MALLLFGVLALVLHEAAHVSMAWLLDITVWRVGMSAKGMYIVRDPGPPRVNLIITLAGPVANLLLACTWPISHQFAEANLILGVTNLLPIPDSDGRRALDLLTGRWTLRSTMA